MKKIFWLEDSPYHSGKYTISIDIRQLPIKRSVSGSFNVLIARVAGLDYPDYLRMCRDIYGAEIIGKNTFMVPFFDNNKKSQELIDWLNKRVNLILEAANEQQNV